MSKQFQGLIGLGTRVPSRHVVTPLGRRGSRSTYTSATSQEDFTTLEKRGYPADDHPTGHPSHLAAVAEPAGSAGLPLLPPVCSPLEPEVGSPNGVVLGKGLCPLESPAIRQSICKSRCINGLEKREQNPRFQPYNGLDRFVARVCPVTRRQAGFRLAWSGTTTRGAGDRFVRLSLGALSRLLAMVYIAESNTQFVDLIYDTMMIKRC